MATVMHSQKADGKAHMFVPSREEMQRRRLLAWMQECERDDSVTYMDLTATYGEPEVHEWECSACGHVCEEVNGSYEYCPHCGRRVIGENR